MLGTLFNLSSRTRLTNHLHPKYYSHHVNHLNITHQSNPPDYHLHITPRNPLYSPALQPLLPHPRLPLPPGQKPILQLQVLRPADADKRLDATGFKDGWQRWADGYFGSFGLVLHEREQHKAKTSGRVSVHVLGVALVHIGQLPRPPHQNAKYYIHFNSDVYNITAHHFL